MFEVHTGADQVGEIERISVHDISIEDFQVRYINRFGPQHILLYLFKLSLALGED